MRDILRLIALHIWIGSVGYLISGVVKIVRWSADRTSAPFSWMDLPPLTSMEFPEHAAIAIAVAGVVNVFTLHLSPMWMDRPLLRLLAGYLVLTLGLYLMIAKGLVCLISADSSIAQLHQITFGSVAAMTLASIWSLIGPANKSAQSP